MSQMNNYVSSEVLNQRSANYRLQATCGLSCLFVACKMFSQGSANMYYPSHSAIEITYLLINTDIIKCLTRLSVTFFVYQIIQQYEYFLNFYV